MAQENFIWIYLIFFLIPLARIIPRIIRKWQNKDKYQPGTQVKQNFQRVEPKQEVFESPRTYENKEFKKTEPNQKPLSDEMRVLGEINRGIKDFNNIQKNLKIDNQELEKILMKFEDEGLMRVIKKNGLTGSKIELYPTEKGFKKFNR